MFPINTNVLEALFKISLRLLDHFSKVEQFIALPISVLWSIQVFLFFKVSFGNAYFARTLPTFSVLSNLLP